MGIVQTISTSSYKHKPETVFEKKKNSKRLLYQEQNRCEQIKYTLRRIRKKVEGTLPPQKTKQKTNNQKTKQNKTKLNKCNWCNGYRRWKWTGDSSSNHGRGSLRFTLCQSSWERSWLRLFLLAVGKQLVRLGNHPRRKTLK